MNAIVMMTSGVAWFAAAAVLALLLAFHKTLSGVIAGIGGAVGSLMTLAAGGVVLIDGQSVDTLIPLGDKAKAPSCRVLHEVDIAGRKVHS